MYSRYIDLFPVSGACHGHRALLMYSMLEFAMLIGRYGRRERQINKHLNDPVAHAACTATRGLPELEECTASPRRSVSIRDLSVAAAKRELCCIHSQLGIPPLMSLHAQPIPPCSRLDTDVAQVTGHQLDTRRQNR